MKNSFSQNLILLISIVGLLYTFPIEVKSQYGSSCSDQYGFMAYEDYTGYCKCMSGYVFGKDSLGNTTCVSGDSICYDKYGYSSRYDSLSGSCECSYGNVLGTDMFGQTKCISETQACKNQYGYNAQSSYGGKCECSYDYVFGNDSSGKTQCVSASSLCDVQLGVMSRYNSLSDMCECISGYVISGGTCTYGNTVCSQRNGLYSSYDSLSKSCECDSGYTLDDSNQCVKKQNNVYFTLKELDTDERRAIIKSDYDYRYYLISYNSGCYASSFRRYLNHQIVVNLGTDFDLDTWDKIVLQDDDETCDITHRERVDSSTVLHPVEEDGATNTYYYVPDAVPTEVVPIPTTPTKTDVIKPPAQVSFVDFKVSDTDIKDFKKNGVLTLPASFRKCPSTQCSIIRYYAKGSKVKITGEYSKGEWYQVEGATDAGGNGLIVSGWIHKSLFGEVTNSESGKELPSQQNIIATTSTSTPQVSNDVGESESKIPWYKKFWKFIWRF